MRVGQNPAKFVNSVAQPASITATVVSCIPFLSGFYEQNLEVLRSCIYSLHENRDRPFDLMVFDNHSCLEVRSFLLESFNQGVIQYLVLSGTNIGKIGAWNFMFGAAQGSYIAFCDSDVYFRPGWLSASLELFDNFPNVGMVTGRPTRTPAEYISTTLAWGKNLGEANYQEGNLLDWDTYLEHTRSLGISDEKAREEFSSGKDYRLTYKGKSAFIGASHFQFVAKKEVLEKVFPLKSEKPMRGEPVLDKMVNDLGYLRLSTNDPYVLHMGNRVPDSIMPSKLYDAPKPWLRSYANNPVIRSILMRVFGVIFHIYFNNID
jgi:glycosyltransferase involved in cell wall biosynthesis